ncbi:TonB family protein [Rheinheimera sp. MMS21-TC3]|uniref:energy transducer TonB n=1 Tax=Rheinheimera sp. MMS21-TC3 TaxID=3072790 RepID=UPI0028C487F1|nr:TonB family protein [Rheinheimera sp. MMS21-TC3]WNO59592.1 TonB family protein [Rheinheimera sp. MMS21-TC3]
MMKKWIFMLAFGSSVAQADMLDALNAYEQKDFAEAQQQFQQLIPLGNELAAFNLGAMAYQGDGQEQNIVQALGYFMLAAELKHEQAKSLLLSVSKAASEQQLEQANDFFIELKQSVKILDTNLHNTRADSTPQPIKRVPPDYPKTAAMAGQFGYVKARFLVDEQGKVTAVDTVDAYPKSVFERASIKAIKRWRYEPSNQKQLLNVRLDFSLSGGVDVSAVEAVVNKHNLWNYAVSGSPNHQFALGTLLSLVDIQSGNLYRYDSELPMTATTDFSVFKNQAEVKADFSGFLGRALVRVAADGTITEQISADVEPKSKVESLVGLKLKGKITTDVYNVSTYTLFDGHRKVRVMPSLQVSPAMSGMFWWEQAAKNGSLEAQRVMAAYDKQWEAYLLNEQDAEVMAWAGSKLLIDGQREQGMQLLEQALAKNYKLAAEMKKQFM